MHAYRLFGITSLTGEFNHMTHNKTFSLYRVTYNISFTFANGETVSAGIPRLIRASSLAMAHSQSTISNGGDIAKVELVAVDSAINGKTARPIASLVSPIATRHMVAFPAKVLARRAMACTSNLRVTAASNRAVTLKMGGAY